MPELGRVFRLDFHISHIGMHPRPSLFALSRDSHFTFETALCRLLEEHVAPGDEVLFVSSRDAREASAERALCQAATWVTMPAPVIGIREQGLGISSAQAVLTSYFDEDVNAAIAATGRFQEAGGVVGRKLWVKRPRGLPAASGREGESEIGSANTEFSNNPVNPVNPVKNKPPPLPISKPPRSESNPAHEVIGLLPLLSVCLGGWIVAGATGVFAATTLFSLFLFMLVLCGVSSPVSVWLAAALSVAVVYGVLPQSASPTAPSRRGHVNCPPTGNVNCHPPSERGVARRAGGRTADWIITSPSGG